MKTGSICLEKVSRDLSNCDTIGDTKAELHLFAQLICDAINEQRPDLKLTTHIEEGTFLTIKGI